MLTGYPPEDLLLKEHFLEAAQEALAAVAADAQGIVALVGFPERSDDVYNALAVLVDGAVHAVYRKTLLPNYGVFDEQRYFQAGDDAVVVDLGERADRAHDLRGHLDPGPSGAGGGAGRGDADPQRLGLAVLRGQGPPARGDARPAGARQPVRRGVLQPRRRAGRARLRRALGGDRPRGHRAGAGAAVRRGADALHGRPPGRRDRAAARHAPAPAGATRPARRAPARADRADAARRVADARRRRRRAARAGGGGVRRALPRRCATTAPRTASSTSCWGCRAGSTRRWWR